MPLARLLRLDEVTSVTVPSIDREAARDLVRAREDCRGDLMRARHRVSKLLLRHGIVYFGGQAWTGRHDAWLRAQHLPTLATRLAFDEGLDAVLTVAPRRDRLDAAITAMAAESKFTEVARRLGCLRGVSTLTGFALAVEIGDWHRFTGTTIGSYLGLVSSEYSSGACRVQGGITKTGNGHARRLPGTTRPGTPSARRCATGGTWPRGRTGPRRRREPAPSRPVGQVQPAEQAARGRQPRDRPGAGRLVLVPGCHGLTQDCSTPRPRLAAARGVIRGTPTSRNRIHDPTATLDARQAGPLQPNSTVLRYPTRAYQ